MNSDPVRDLTPEELEALAWVKHQLEERGEQVPKSFNLYREGDGKIRVEANWQPGEKK